jgi:rubrerythrin
VVSSLSRIEDLASYFRREAEKEREYARRLEETASKSRNIMLKALMKAVSLDSLKHANLYEALADLISNPRLVTEEESEAVAREIEAHIREEAEAVEELKRLLEDERIKSEPAARFLVEVMLRDEHFHHALLKRLEEAVLKPLLFTEQDYWEAVWRDVPWHGAPGG